MLRYPTVTLNVECNTPLASLAIRLCEVSPRTGASHLVTHRFFIATRSSNARWSATNRACLSGDAVTGWGLTFRSRKRG